MTIEKTRKYKKSLWSWGYPVIMSKVLQYDMIVDGKWKVKLVEITKKNIPSLLSELEESRKTELGHNVIMGEIDKKKFFAGGIQDELFLTRERKKVLTGSIR